MARKRIPPTLNILNGNPSKRPLKVPLDCSRTARADGAVVFPLSTAAAVYVTSTSALLAHLSQIGWVPRAYFFYVIRPYAAATTSRLTPRSSTPRAGALRGLQLVRV